MAVSVHTSKEDLSQLIVELSKDIYTKLFEYFCKQDALTNEIIDQESSVLSKSKSIFGMLNAVDVLREIKQLLQANIRYQIDGHHFNEYTYLQSTWVNHNERCRKQNLSCYDKIDNLNKTISMIKMHTKQMIQLQTKKNNEFWKKQILETTIENIWDHPFFQKMNEQINNLKMQKIDLEYALSVTTRQRKQFANKNKELQQKLYKYKQKNKKSEKQIFEISKKKAELEKQIISKGRNMNHVQKELFAQNNKQNYNKNSMQYISFLKQQNYMTQSVKPPQSQFSQLSIKQKFKYAAKKPTACISPNTSLDSIRSVKFERATNRKLLIK